jgi:hypothetical protein
VVLCVVVVDGVVVVVYKIYIRLFDKKSIEIKGTVVVVEDVVVVLSAV